jgi:glycosyltransferase involved in cell wall biosynthesis/predicted metal-dependent phosphoesterase TrpH
MNDSDFRSRMQGGIESLFSRSAARLQGEIERIDLHCHDHNSRIPDESLGRMLGVPETWLPTADLLRQLRDSSTTCVTVTNHNNARSCFDLLDAGHDVLVGAEFSCTVPDLDIGIHVLTYGFSPEEEQKLNARRVNIYEFLDFAAEREIPTILAHPLQFYAPRGVPEPEDFDKLLLLFSSFEVVNGQRDGWQNLLAASWVEGAGEEFIADVAKRHGVAPDRYCRKPFAKRLCGGSDDHFGVFAGQTGTLLELPPDTPRGLVGSQRALYALRYGSTAPYGAWNDGEKLHMALLDYFTQVVMHMEDPGLMRILLHKGSWEQKLWAVGISNAIVELRRHRFTLSFLQAFHDAIRKGKPGLVSRFLMSRRYPALYDVLSRFRTLRAPGNTSSAELAITLPKLFRSTSSLLVDRIGKKQAQVPEWSSSLTSILEKLEIPSSIRSLVEDPVSEKHSRYKMTPFNVREFFDGLSFPFLASAVIAGASFASTRALQGKRDFKVKLSRRYDWLSPPRRALWLTDTFGDANGVSGVLRLMLEHVEAIGAEIDFATCSNTLASSANLRVLKPLSEFTLPVYRNQPIRIPDLLEFEQLMTRGSYDRIVCSTEGPMALVALYLKHAFDVPAYLYVHTDWLTFSATQFNLDEVSSDRFRRGLRALYRCFDGLIVLNSEQEEIFSGPLFDIPREKIFRTAHWISEKFSPIPGSTADGEEAAPILVYAGRVAREKGVFELPVIFERARAVNPNVELWVAGMGPDLEELKRLVPDARFLGWQSPESLAAVFRESSLLLLPSRFDTFGCVVLEAMSVGLPVCAYDTKGPRDIVEHNISGFLASSQEEFVAAVEGFCRGPSNYSLLRQGALARSQCYTANAIFPPLLSFIGLGAQATL